MPLIGAFYIVGYNIMHEVEQAILETCINLLGSELGTKFFTKGMGIPQELRVDWFDRMLSSIKTKNAELIKPLSIYKIKPVSVKEFIENPYYAGPKSPGEPIAVYPKIIKELEEINNGKYVEVIWTGGIGPLSCDTEFLTPTGWVRMDSYKEGIPVAEYNIETAQLEFRLPLKYEIRPCDWFYKFTSKYSVDMVLSPAHRVLYTDQRGNFQVRPAEIIANKCLTNSVGFSGKFITTFNPPDYEGVSITTAQLQLQVAVQADGSFDKREPYSTYCRVHLKKDRKKNRLVELLISSGTKFNSKDLAREGYTLYTFNAPIRAKDFNWAWKCSKDQLKVITDELNHWNGSFSDGRYTTTNKESADFVQYAYSALGLRAVISSTDNLSSLCKGTPKTLYRVGATTRNLPSLCRTTVGDVTPIVTKIPSIDGKMYCFSTKTGFFVARYNGKVFITGNSGKTTGALYTTLYQLYLLSCMKDPHGSFGLDKTSEILFIFQSLNAGLSKSLDYARFRAMVDNCPYFTHHFPYNKAKNVSERLIFPNRIEVVPLTGQETAAIGQNVIGGCFPPTQRFIKSDGTISTLDKSLGAKLLCYTIDDSNYIGISNSTRVVNTGIKKLIRLDFSNGSAITCTPDQKFKTTANIWLKAEEAYGHNFKTINMQTLRESGYVFNSTSEVCTSNDRQGIQNTVSNGKTNWGAFFGNYSQEYSGQRESILPDMQTIIQNDYSEASTLSWNYSSTVYGCLSYCEIENRDCERGLGGQVSRTCVRTTQRPRLQEVFTTGDSKSGSFGSESYARKDERPCGTGKIQQETNGMVGRSNGYRESIAPTKITTTKLFLSNEKWIECDFQIKTRVSSGLLFRPFKYPLVLRENAYTVCGRSGETTSVYPRFHNKFLSYRGEDRFHYNKKPQTLGIEIFSQDRATFSNYYTRSDEISKVTFNLSMDGSKFTKELCYDLQHDPIEVGSITCTKITVFSEQLVPVYDIENTGFTHTFFVVTDNVDCCLIAKNCLDELNYMNVTQNSKKSIDGGSFDQAIALYNSIARRRKSRFQSAGSLPGILCLVSSKRYPGQFTDLKEEEAKRDPTIYIYDKRVWDVKPDGSFSGVFFEVFVGDESRKPRILGEDDYIDPKDRHLVDHIPIEFKEDFTKDITNALREIAGKSTLARHPFILDTEAIARAMNRNDSIFSKDSVDFVIDQLEVYPDNFYKPEIPRYAHIDLGITGDSAGLTIGTITGFKKITRSTGERGELLPMYHIDGTLEVRPPKGGEIQFWKIRDVLYALRDLGLNIQWVSLDTFQAKDTQQILKQKGFFTGTLSMDTSSLPYEITKSALYDGRVSMPYHAKLLKELASLEFDPAKGKIDHPQSLSASKDCSDSFAGTLAGALSRRAFWGLYGISPIEISEIAKSVVKDTKDTEKLPK